MFINEVKQQIRYTVQVYLKKNEYGNYRIPPVSQRPVFLIGPPGIGKSAIMEQIAQEMGIALVSYSMTHHTRQSALGLPVLEKKTFDGQEYTVCRYSMSEIIGAIHQTMEESGIREGILFLDEINCISETLMPSMLQFLQYKRFGEHKVPPGWIVVTAGNPPEYNRSARNLDIVTLDRLKVIEVDSDYDAWRSYASANHIHPAVTGYLDTRRDDFYNVEIDAGEKSYVTARGWEDLSQILYLTEEEHLPVDENLVTQYIRHRDIAREFTLYYALFNKYRMLYEHQDLRKGTLSDDLLRRLRKARFDEKTAVVHMLLDGPLEAIRNVTDDRDVLSLLLPLLKQVRQECADGSDCMAALDRKILYQQEFLRKAVSAHSLSREKKEQTLAVEHLLHQLKKNVLLEEGKTSETPSEVLRSAFNRLAADLRDRGQAVSARLESALEMIETLYGADREMLLAVTELTADPKSAKFISNFGSLLYDKYSEALLLDERRIRIEERLEKLSL